MSNKNKNSFGEFKDDIKVQGGKIQPNSFIIKDKMDNVMSEKFHMLVQMYKGHSYENGYNASLAFRVIWLFLYCQLKPQQLNLTEEMNRYLNHQLPKQNLQTIQKCMDLLLIKQLAIRVADKIYKLWEIRILKALKKYYSVNHLKKQKKKASLTMRQLCKEQLKKESVKHDPEIYQSVIDILLEEEKIIMISKKAHGKLFEALENGNNIIRILQKAQRSIIPKYQEQLMLAYWQISKLHHQLHYVTYAKKYAETTLNIAQRINNKKISQAAQNFLDDLATAV